MNFKFLLGVATGVGVTLFLRSSRGKDFKKNLGESVALGLLKGEDALHTTLEASENLRIKVIEQTHQN